ncbi:hypothetical protein [Tessaracoccus sp.]
MNLRRNGAWLGAVTVGALFLGVGWAVHSSSATPAPGPYPLTTPSVSARTVPVPPPVAVPTTPTADPVAVFEKENAIAFPEVVKREVKYGNSLWVYTSLSRNRDRAGEICGAYALYVLEDPRVTVTTVRAADGYGLATCGPGA